MMHIFAVMLLQTGSSNGDQRLLIFFIGLVAVAVLLQAGVLLAMALRAHKTQKQLLSIAEDVRDRALPVLDSARSLVEYTSPKIKSISANLEETSALLRNQAEMLDEAVADALARAMIQVARVDGLVTNTLEGANEVVAEVQRGIMGPVQQITGILNGIRAGLDVLRGKFGMRKQRPDGDDMFV